MCLIGKEAPEAVADAVIEGKEIQENYNLADLRGKYVLLFFYPADFTFVCPSELHAFQTALPEFEKRGCQVVGASVDGKYSHYAWLQKPKKEGGIKGVTYPILADITKVISRNFGVLNEEKGIAYRGLFLIDKEGIVRHSLINDFPLGRSVEEALRILDALKHTEKNGEVCPADWKVGEKAIKADHQGLKDYFS